MYLDLLALSHIERTILQSKVVSGTKFYSENKWFDPVLKRLEGIVGKTNKARYKSTRWFLTCTAKAIRHRGEGFCFGMHTSWFTGTKQKIGHANSVDIVELLENEGYIDVYKGCVELWGTGDEGTCAAKETHPTVVIMKQKYLDLWSDVCLEKIPQIKDEEPIILRDRKTKESLSLQGWKGVGKMREGLERLNGKLAETEIRINDEVCASVQYNRIFSDDLEKDGRFYVIGGGVQTAPAILRKTSLFIGDDKTVELDFKAMHPRLLLEMLSVGAAREGEEFEICPSFSPYDAEIESLIELDYSEIEKQSNILGTKYDPVRNLKKQALLVMINAKSEAAARGALCQKLATDKKRPDPIDRLFVGIKGALPIKEIMSRIYEHNEIIADHMYNDTGIALMNMDSRIAERVIDAMLQEDEPILCYHDSFIVKEYMEDYLRLSMENAWKAVMLDNKFCKIEKK